MRKARGHEQGQLASPQDTCVAVPDGPLLPVCPRNSGAPVAHGLLYNTSFTRLSPTLVIGLLRALYLFRFCSAPRTWHLHDKHSIQIY